MNQENGKGIIFGVLGILTLIIAIMGASLAYFTATAMDTDPQKIVVQAATVTIEFGNGKILEAKDLIPAAFNVVEWAYKDRGVEKDPITQIEEDKQCKDDKGYTVCGIYRFSVSNEYGKNDSAIVGTIETATEVANNKDGKEFENLMYTVYEVEYENPDDPSTATSRTEINVNHHTTFGKFGVVTDMFKHDTMEGLSEKEVKVPAGAKKYYEIVIWLNEKSNDVTTDNGEGNQDAEQGLTYTGVVNVTVSGASDKITGTIGQ